MDQCPMDVIIDKLKVNRSLLVQRLDIEHGLLNDLVSLSVLEYEHLEDIQAKDCASKKNECLLDILKKRDYDKVQLFIEILKEKQNDLWKRFTRDDGSIEDSTSRKGRLVRYNGNKLDETVDPLHMENENLKYKIKELEKQLADASLQLKEYNSKLEGAIELTEQFNCVSLELQGTKKQCSLLTNKLCSAEDEVKRLKHQLEFKITKNSELELFLEKKSEEKRKLEMRIIEIEEKYPKSVKEIRQTGKNIQVRGGSVIMGLSMLNRRIYVVCLRTKTLFVFSDNPPYEQMFLEEFDIKELNNPRDIASSERDRQLFISDDDSEKGHKIWRLSLGTNCHVLGRAQSQVGDAPRGILSKNQSLDVFEDGESLYKVTKTSVDRRPGKLFACSGEDKQIGTLLVVLVSESIPKTADEDSDQEEYLVYIYKITDMKLLRKVIFDSNLGEILHVIVQPQMLKNSKSVNFNNVFEALPGGGGDPLSQANFIVSHKSTIGTQHGETKTAWLITKLSCDGSTVLSSFSPPVVDGVCIVRPEYMTLMEACRILVADQENNRLVVLGPKFGGSQVMVKNDNRCSCDKPARVVCHLAKKMVVVSHWGKKGLFSVFTH